MKITDIIGEHNKVPPVDFPIPTLTDGKDIGNVPLKSGLICQVYEQTDEHGNIILIAHKQSQILGFIGLLKIHTRTNMFMVKNSKSLVSGENTTLNLMIFARHYYGIVLISDYEISDQGEAALLSMIKNPVVGFKIYNFDEDKIYDLNDLAATKPEDDTNHDADKINWFYILRENRRFPNSRSLIQPFYHVGGLSK